MSLDGADIRWLKFRPWLRAACVLCALLCLLMGAGLGTWGLITGGVWRALAGTAAPTLPELVLLRLAAIWLSTPAERRALRRPRRHGP